MATKTASKAKTKKGSITQHDGRAFAEDIGTVLGVIDAGRDIVVVRKSEYKGRTSLDIRRFWAPDDSKEWAPSSKGVSIPANDVGDFYVLLDRARMLFASKED